MSPRRFQPPLTGDVGASRAYDQLSRILDARDPPALYPIRTEARVSVASGSLSRVRPPSTGGEVVLPAPSSENFAQTITLLVRSGGRLRVRGVSGTIGGATALVVPAGFVGELRFLSDGEQDWSGPLYRVGSDVVIPAAGEITLDAGGNLHLHSGDTIHLGHAGSTQEIHAEAGTIELLTDVNGISLSSATTANISATSSSTIQTGTFFAVNATGGIDLICGSDFRVQGATDVEINGVGGVVLSSTASPTTNPSTGDVRLVADDDVLIDAADDLLATVGDIFQLTAGSVTFIPTSMVSVLGSGILQIGSGATDGFIVVEGTTASTPTVNGGDGMFWCEDPSGGGPTLPIWTDDTNADRHFELSLDGVQSVGTTGTIGTITLTDDSINVIRWGGGSGTATLAGLAGSKWNGRRVKIRNIDGTSGDTLTLLPDSAATATDGFHAAGTGASNDASRQKVIRNRGSVDVVWDSTSTRWYVDGI